MTLDIKGRCRKLRVKNWRNMISPNLRGGKSLICNNCTGAMVLHDFGLRFDTPTVNLFIPPYDYVKMLHNLEEYMNKEIVDAGLKMNYPVGMLGDVRIDFLHYSTIEQAIETWKRRAERVDYENLYVVLVERDGCTHNDLLEFDLLPFKHKVALVHKKYPDIKCAYVIENYEENGQLKPLTDFRGWLGQRWYDVFDWFNFLELNK